MKFWVPVELLCLGIGALLPAVTTAQGTSETRPVLHVSVFDETRVGTNMLRKAEGQASRVFRRANIDVVWLQCPQDSLQQTSVGRCSEASYPTHLHLRVVMRSHGVKESILGMAFQSGDGKGCYADLFQERLRELQEESQVDAAIILGHAMAHELGHLLLGTNSHSRDGLMRAHWEPADLAQAAKGNLLFSSEESTRMRGRFTGDDSEQLAVLVHRSEKAIDERPGSDRLEFDDRRNRASRFLVLHFVPDEDSLNLGTLADIRSLSSASQRPINAVVSIGRCNTI